MNRFDYVKYDEHAIALQGSAKAMFETISIFIETMPRGRAQALALTKLEESYMWVGKAIRDHQIESRGSAELQEQRKDG